MEKEKGRRTIPRIGQDPHKERSIVECFLMQPFTGVLIVLVCCVCVCMCVCMCVCVCVCVCVSE